LRRSALRDSFGNAHSAWICLSPASLLFSYESSLRIPWGVRFQDERQRQHRRRDRRLPSLCFSIQTRQLFLERFIQQFVTMLTQKDKQFRFANLFHNLLFLLIQLDWGLPPDPFLG